VARTSKIARRLLAGAVLLGTVLAGATFAAGPASASTAPVVYAARNNGWHGYTRPGTFIFGNGGAPYFTALQWKSWGSGSAWGTGKLWTQKPGCSPSYKCTYSSRWAGVYLNTARTHNGVRYYARMAVEFFVSGKARWVIGWFGIHGGTVPYWQFPAVFPYL
jgi:hypothetical protein